MTVWPSGLRRWLQGQSVRAWVRTPQLLGFVEPMTASTMVTRCNVAGCCITRAQADSPCRSPGTTVTGWSEQAPGHGDMHAARLPPLNSCIEPMRTPGVEPGSQAWEACMMPLHYVRWWLCRNKHLNRLSRHLYIFKFSITSRSPGCSCSVTESPATLIHRTVS